MRTGAGSSRTGGPRKGSVMAEDWKTSSGSEFVPSDVGTSSNDSVSLVEESGDDVGVSGSDGDDSDDAAHVDADSGDSSGKGRGRKMRRELIVEGRWWR